MDFSIFFISFILAFIFLFLLMIIFVYKKRNKFLEQEISILEKEKEEGEKIGNNLAEYREQVNLLKKARKTKILNLLEFNKNISNDDVADKLGISRTSAFRYLEELQRDGKISQIGKTGRFVSYSLVKKRNN
ncbi:MAG: winged helix-turn-helix domain-containing protein [Candidatus Paceibacterota bacterium]|jgi:predicted HTH transcriptional regulator